MHYLLKAPYLVRTIPQIPVKATKMNKNRRWSFQKETEVIEKKINETTRETVIKGLPAAWQKKTYEVKKSPPGTVARLTATWAAQ